MEYLKTTRAIRKIEATQKSSEQGKYFVETTKAEMLEAQKAFDEKLEAPYATNTIPQSARYASMPNPYKANNKQPSESMSRYVQQIQAPTKDQYSDAKAWYANNMSRQWNVMFSNENYPRIQE